MTEHHHYWPVLDSSRAAAKKSVSHPFELGTDKLTFFCTSKIQLHFFKADPVEKWHPMNEQVGDADRGCNNNYDSDESGYCIHRSVTCTS